MHLPRPHWRPDAPATWWATKLLLGDQMAPGWPDWSRWPKWRPDFDWSCAFWANIRGLLNKCDQKQASSGAGVICYSLDCYTRFATPLLLQFVTAISNTTTMGGAIDHFCYSLPLLHLILLHRFYCYYRHCYRGAALEKSTFDLCPQKNFHPLFLSTSSSVLKKLC